MDGITYGCQPERGQENMKTMDLTTNEVNEERMACKEHYEDLESNNNVKDGFLSKVMDIIYKIFGGISNNGPRKMTY